jgi:hypothetical protein
VDLRLRIIEEVIVQSSAKPDESAIYLWLPYLIAYGVLAWLDSRMIARSGNLPRGKVLNAWWFLLAPVYLWQRASYLKKRKTQFWTWIVCFVAALAFQLSSLSDELFATGIPECGSRYATKEVMKLFNDIDSMIKSNTKALILKSQREIDATKNGDEITSRSCTGTINATDDTDHRIIYKFDKENGQLYIHVQIL